MDRPDYQTFERIEVTIEEDWSKGTIFGYYDNNELTAWSAYYEYPSKSTAHADQFAWNYKNPKLKLGYKSLRSEIAYFKSKGFDYLILGDIYSYKQEIQGFEYIFGLGYRIKDLRIRSKLAGPRRIIKSDLW